MHTARQQYHEGPYRDKTDILHGSSIPKKAQSALRCPIPVSGSRGAAPLRATQSDSLAVLLTIVNITKEKLCLTESQSPGGIPRRHRVGSFKVKGTHSLVFISLCSALYRNFRRRGSRCWFLIVSTKPLSSQCTKGFWLITKQQLYYSQIGHCNTFSRGTTEVTHFNFRHPC